MVLSAVMLVAESAAEGGESVRELPMPAYMFGLVALAFFALLLAVTWAFRGTAAKIGERNAPHSAHSTSGQMSGSDHR